MPIFWCAVSWEYGWSPVDWAWLRCFDSCKPRAVSGPQLRGRSGPGESQTELAPEMMDRGALGCGGQRAGTGLLGRLCSMAEWSKRRPRREELESRWATGQRGRSWRGEVQEGRQEGGTMQWEGRPLGGVELGWQGAVGDGADGGGGALRQRATPTLELTSVPQAVATAPRPGKGLRDSLLGAVGMRANERGGWSESLVAGGW
jgi:hypothetical protein